MGRRIAIRFLDADHTRAEVVVTYSPGRLARLFGFRAQKQTTIAVFGGFPKHLPAWLYASDRTHIEDTGITHALVQARRWETTDVAELPQARVVKGDA